MSSTQVDDDKATNGIDLTALKTQLDHSSGLNRTLGLVFVALLMYVGITLSSVTDLMLLLPNTPVTLPLLSIDIPLFAFFAITPLIVLGLHLNILLNLLSHSQKLYRWVAQNPVEEAIKLTEVHPFIFNRLAFKKSKTVAYWLSGFLVKVVVFYLPLVLLLIFQVRFSDYHNMTMTRWHMGVAMADLLLLLLFQPAILNKRNFELNGPMSRNCIKLMTMLGNWLKLVFPKRLGFVLFLSGNLVYSCDNVHLLGEVMTSKQTKELKNLFEHEYRFPQDLFTKYKKDSIIHLGDSFVHNNETLAVHSWPQMARVFNVDTIYPCEYDLERTNESREIWRFIDTVSIALNHRCLRYKPNIEVKETNLLKIPVDSRYVTLLMEKENTSPQETKRKAQVEFGEGISLKGRHLSHADLSKCVLSHVDMREAVLFKTNLRFAHLEGADFSYAHLEGVYSSYAYLEGADFLGSHLEGADFSNAHLERADFRNDDLSGANFSGTHLEGADFSYAHLEGARFPYADMEGTDFSRAHLEGAYFEGADMKGIDFSYAHLEGACFLGAHLGGAVFSDTHLEGADFSFADLEGAFFESAFLRGVETTTKGFKGSLMDDLNFTTSYNFDSLLMKVDSTHISHFSYGWFKNNLRSAASRLENPTSLEIDSTDWKLFLEARLKLVCNPNLSCVRLIINRRSFDENSIGKIIWHNDSLIHYAKIECAEKYNKYIQNDYENQISMWNFSRAIQTMIRKDLKELSGGEA